MRPKRSREDSSAGSGTGKTSKESKKREKGQSRGSGGKPVKGAAAGTGGAGGAVKAARGRVLTRVTERNRLRLRAGVAGRALRLAAHCGLAAR